MIKILIVDDKETNLYSLSSILCDLKSDDYKFEVKQALGGEQALRMTMLDPEIELILLDIQMPDVNGFEVAKLIKANEKTKHIPIVFITAAFKADEFIQQGFEIGAIDYITKPIEKIPFLNKIRLYLQLTVKTNSLKKLNYHLEFDVENKVRELQLLNVQLSNYIQLIDDNVVTSSTDLNGNITTVSNAFCKITGYTREELIGQNHSILRHPEMNDEFFKQMWQTISENQQWHGEIKNKKKNGKTFWVDSSIFAKVDEKANKTGYYSIIYDITDKKRVEKLSITDALTGINNRRYFDEVYVKTINSSKRKNELLCFMMLDIDYFKLYNDNFGHQKGDKALIEIAAELKSNLTRADDLYFRLGGEEFGILIKAEKEQSAVELAEKIRKSIENLHICCKSACSKEYLTVSIGIVCKKAKEIMDSNLFYNQADKLLYQAKNLGRNRVFSSIENEN